MSTVRIPEELQKRLETLVENTKRSRSFYLREALEEYLDEHEDLLNALAVKERIQKGTEKLYTIEEARKVLGLDHETH